MEGLGGSPTAPEGAGDRSLFRCLMLFHGTQILYQPWLGSAGVLERNKAQSLPSEIYGVAGLRDSIKSSWRRYHRQRMEVESMEHDGAGT